MLQFLHRVQNRFEFPALYLQKLWLPSPRRLASVFLAVNLLPLSVVEFQLMHSAPEWLVLHVPRYPSPRPTTHFSLVSVDGKKQFITGYKAQNFIRLITKITIREEL